MRSEPGGLSMRHGLAMWSAPPHIPRLNSVYPRQKATSIWGSSLCTQEKNLLPQLGVESQRFTLTTFFRLTSPKHQSCSEGRICDFLWEAVVKASCARWEGSKIPTDWKGRTRNWEEPAGTREGRWEQPHLGWRVIVRAWGGLETSGELCLRFEMPHWRGDQIQQATHLLTCCRGRDGNSGTIFKCAVGERLGSAGGEAGTQ